MSWWADLWDNLTDTDPKPAEPRVKAGSQRPGSATIGQKGTLGIGSGYSTDRKPGNFYDRAAVKRGAAPMKKTSEAYRGPMARPENAFARMAMPAQRPVQAPQQNVRQAMEADSVGRNSPLDILGGGQAVDPLEDLIAGMQENANTPYGGIDPAVKAMIEGAFGSRFGAIDKAEGTANANFGKSKAELSDLYAGHVSDIQNVDSARYKDISENWKEGIQQTYDQSIGAAQGDRNAERARGEEMLARLGIQGAAPLVQQNADLLSEGIQGMQENKAAYMNQAEGYGAADLSRNVARGQAVASEGAERQGDLAQQLQSILGNLGNERVETEQEKAMAMMEADQQGRSAWQEGQALNVESLTQLLDQRMRENDWQREGVFRQEDQAFEREMMDREMQATAAEQATKAAPTGSIFENMARQFGMDPNTAAQYRDVYNDVGDDYLSNTGQPYSEYLKKKFKMAGLPGDHNGDVSLYLDNIGTFKQ